MRAGVMAAFGFAFSPTVWVAAEKETVTPSLSAICTVNGEPTIGVASPLALFEGLLSEMRDAAATDTLEKISERMASVQGDLTEMQEALRTLREEVSSIRGRANGRRRWGRFS